MSVEHAAKPEFFSELKGSYPNRLAVVHTPPHGIVLQVGEPARHSRPEINSGRSENDSDTSRHVLTRVLADALDHRQSAAVADSKSFSCAAGDVKFSACSSVQQGVAGQYISA